MRASRFLLVPALAFAVSSVQAQPLPAPWVDSPYNVIQNGGFETKHPNGNDNEVPGWNTSRSPYSQGGFSSSQGYSVFAPTTGTGAAYMNVFAGPTAAVFYQEFTIAPIPLRDCSQILGHRSCVDFGFQFGTRDQSDLVPNDFHNGFVDLRRNMTSLENYPGHDGNGPPPDERNFLAEPPCIPYYDAQMTLHCDPVEPTPFWYGMPDENTRQFVTVDLLRGGADPFSMDSDDVLLTFFRGANLNFGSMGSNYTTGSEVYLDAIMRDGGTFMLRFGVAANLYSLDFAVDDVALIVYDEPVPAPEPGSLSLMALGLAAFGVARRRRRS